MKTIKLAFFFITTTISLWIKGEFIEKQGAKIFYTEKDIPYFSALQFLEWIVIEKDDINNMPLLYHELDHVDYWRENKIEYIKSIWDMDLKYKIELRAHIVEVKHGAKLEYSAMKLSSNYQFDKTYKECLRAIKEGL